MTTKSLYLILALSLAAASSLGLSWTIETVDTSARLGSFISLALDQSGNPFICYFDSVGRDLMFAYKTGGSWVVSPVDTNGDVGRYCKLPTNLTGLPKISYFDSTGRSLKYAWYDGTTWQIEVADTGPGVGQFVSLASGPAGPIIAYYDQEHGDLKLAQKTSAWSLNRIDSSGNTGRFASLMVSNAGSPSIAYYSDTLGLLRYAYYQNGWKFQNPDPSIYCGHYLSSSLGQNGHPRLAYLDSVGGYLKYAVRTNPVQWTQEAIDSTGRAGGFISLALDPLDNPAIAYQDRIQGRLCLAYKNNSLWTRETIDTTGPGISPVSCRIGPDTTFYIAYRNARGHLQIARSSQADLWPPVVSALSIVPDTISENGSAVLRATVSDNRAVADAEYFIDAPGPYGSGKPLRFQSGQGSTQAAVFDTVSAAGLSSGRHLIYVHGVDSAGQWGGYDSTSFYIVSQFVLNEFLPEALVYAWPNPARGDRVYFHFYVAVDAEVTAEVFDLEGRLAARIQGRGRGGVPPHSLGSNHLVWEIPRISSDVYLLKLTASGAGGQKATVIKKFAIVK